jgi:hypothetical protein
MPYMVTFTINIPQTLAYIPYMDPMGMVTTSSYLSPCFIGIPLVTLVDSDFGLQEATARLGCLL